MQPDEFEQLDDKEKVGAEQPAFESPEKPTGRPTPESELPGGPSGDKRAAETPEKGEGGSKSPYDSSPKNFRELAARTAQTLHDNDATKGKGLIGKIGKRKLWVTIGLGGGFVGAIVGGIIAILPLRLENIIQNIIQKDVTDKVEYMVEKRMDKMIIRFLFEQANASTGAGIYTDPSLLKTMYGNWRLGNFEAKFTENTGYKIEQIIENGRVTGGIRLVDGEGRTSWEGTDPDKFEKFLGDNKGKDARRFIRTVAKDQTKWYQVMQRRNLRRFMRNAYGIRKWSWFKGTEGEDEAAKAISSDEITSAMGPFEEEVPKLMDCALEGKECAAETGNPDEPHGHQDTTPPNSSTQDGKADETKSDVNDAVKEAEAKAQDEAANSRIAKGITKALSKFMSDELASKIGGKFVPVLGEIMLVDQAARVDHFMHSGQGDKVLRSIYKVQYAQLFAQWLGKDDNFKDNKKNMSGDEVNVIMNQLSGGEKAAGYQRVTGGSGGKKLDQGLEASDTGTPIADAYNIAINPRTLPEVGGLRAWYSGVDGTAAHYIIDAINAVVDFIASHLVNLALDIIPGGHALANSGASLLMKVLQLLIRPAVDGTEIAADLVNAIEMGGAVVGQEFAHSIGGHPLTIVESNQMDREIALNKAADADPSLKYKLFSPDNDSSLTTRIAMMTPLSFKDAVGQFSAFSASVFRNPLSLFSGSAYAAPASSNGLTDYGATAADLAASIENDNLDAATQNAADRLSKPVAEVKPDEVELSDCPNVSEDQLNLCRLDLTAIQSGNPLFTNDDDGGLGDTSAATGGDTTDPGSDSTAGATIDLATLYDDSSRVACADNTKSLGIADGYTAGKKVKIRICAITNITSTGEESKGRYGVSGADGKLVVNSRVSGAVYAMVEAAKKDNVTLTAISGFRTMAHQRDLCPCDGVNVAVPGTSNHQMGLAIDFGNLPSSPGPITGNATWDWLAANASKFDYKNYPHEAWHWSPTGS
jgi:hypothetical protein